MSTPTDPEHPELLVLNSLLVQCRQICRLNPSYDVRKAALDYEAKFEAAKARLVAKMSQEPQATEVGA